jgi:hypothetical protein
MAKGDVVPPTLVVKGSIVHEGVKLHWKPLLPAETYSIQWQDEDGDWVMVALLEGDEIKPNAKGFIEHIDSSLGQVTAGGTYQVSTNVNGKRLTSAPVVVRPERPKRSSNHSDLLKRKPVPASVKAQIVQLKWSTRGFTCVLPKSTAEYLGKRFELEVRTDELSDKTLALLATILTNLPSLVARVGKAHDDYGGLDMLDDGYEIRRPRIVIDDSVPKGKSVGNWTVVIEVKNSDYAWHVEFAGTRFKRIWAGG